MPSESVTQSRFAAKEIFLTKGVGRHRDREMAYKLALKDAGVSNQNIILVSSIFPPGCKIIDRDEGLKKLTSGKITFCVMAKNYTDEKSRLIAASVGIAIPVDPNTYGYLSEFHGYGLNEEEAGRYAEDLAASMLASSLGIEIDDTLPYGEKKEIWKMSDKIVKTRHITQTAIGLENGQWTAVFAAAVFVL